MIIFEKQSALAVFYYLIAVDGNVSEEELVKFDEIGQEVDPDGFPNYKDALINACQDQMNNIIDEEDHYDVIIEGIDKALANRADSLEDGLTSRMLIWDLMTISFIDEDYSNLERKLIKHIVRVLEIDKSIFLEMEQLMKTNVSVTREKEWLQQSNRPYNEIAPIVDELEKRINAIRESASCLIRDEILVPTVEKLEIKQDFIDIAKEKVGDKMAPVAEKIGDARDAVAEKVAPAAAEIGEKAGKIFNTTRGKLFSGIKSLQKDKNDSAEE